jgi:hypothetical protein
MNSSEETIPVKDPVTLNQEDAAPVQEDAAPVQEDAAPVPEDAAPVPEDAAPVPEDAAPVPEDAAPVPEDAAPVPEDAAPVPEDAAPVQEGEAPVPEGEAPVPEGEAPVPEGEAPVPEGEAPVPEGEAPVPEGEASVQEDAAPEKGSSEPSSLEIELKAFASPQEKLEYVIEFMEKSLSQAGTPLFKRFWEARKICVELFKESIVPAVRTTLWTKYRELSQEARRLKDILDEQSAFAAEQIDIAITALEKDIGLLGESPWEKQRIDLELPYALSANDELYVFQQKELNFYNALATRISSLRKEVIKTEMRIRFKNKFFKRLSAIGDAVFPQRKKLIKNLSDLFITDIDLFVTKHGSSKESIAKSVKDFRDEIKYLQAVAKQLTLNTQAFSHSRKKLSECWELLKDVEKERRKEYGERKQVFKENSDAIRELIKTCVDQFAEGKITISDAKKELENISQVMRDKELGYPDVKALRQELWEANRPMDEQEKAEELKRKEKALAKEAERLQAVEALRTEMESALEKSTDSSVEELEGSLTAAIEKLATLHISKKEKFDFDRGVKSLKLCLQEKKEEALLNLSDDDKSALEQFTQVLNQRLGRRVEVREQLEELRKANSASGLDFEQAICHQELLDQEKANLLKINQGITEIEKKIRALKAKV